MEPIANILMGTVSSQRSSRRELRISTTPSQVSNEHEPDEDRKNRFQIRSDQAIADGWSWNEEPPEPKNCEYCGKALFHIGIVSPLQEKRVFTWMKEPEHCDCEKAQAYWAKVEAERIAAEEEKKRQEEADRIQRRINKLIRDSGIRGRFLNRTFERFEIDEYNRRAYEVAKRYADTFPAMLPKKLKDGSGSIQPPDIERNGLFITGSYGTGKTHLATAISNQLISGGIPVICMTMIDLLAKIKQTFDRNDEATEAEIMKIYEEVPLLVIDDIGSEQPTEWGSTKIFSIINARYEAYMPIVVTTNYAGDELIRRMTPIGANGRPLDSRNAEKTLDRLKEMCVGIEMNWESWRSR
jgi:DNA replication protein DnaC